MVMNKRSIDVDVVSAAFQYLADTPEGHAALEELNRALVGLKDKVKPHLNDHEFKYLIDFLILQREVGDFRWHLKG